MTKTLILSLLFSVASVFTIHAQRFAYVDLNEIMESSKEYQNAQAELDRLAKQWRQEIAQEYDKIKGMYNKYQAEQVLMSEEQKKQREEEIMEKERQVRELQKSKFGPEGALFQKRQELVAPIQEQVFEVIEEYADSRGYDFILDKGGAAGILFASPEYDKTEDVLDMLREQ